MLIDFTVENFRSYKNAKTFSLVASATGELAQNLEEVQDHLLIRVAAIYGANASGKSNLLDAMNVLTELLTRPRQGHLFDDSFDDVEVVPFALDAAFSNRPTRFVARFFLDNIRYDYTIAVRKGLISEEALDVYPHGRKQEWFSRSGNEITINSTHLKGPKEKLKQVTAKNIPFLAVAAGLGHPQLTPPAQWLGNNIRRRIFAARPSRGMVSSRCFQSKAFNQWVNLFLCHADLGIQRVEIEPREEIVRRRIANTTAEVTRQVYEPLFVHSGADGLTARFPIEYESNGTRRLFFLLTALYDALQGEVQLLVIDEFGESMHPSLAREIVRQFQDSKTNPHGHQLVFTTHDTSLLSGSLFRRDQVWFTEKDSSGATDLYSLHDIKNVREDEAFEKGYLRGRYGAIPFFGSFDFAAQENDSSERRGSRSRAPGTDSGTEKNDVDID
jgi:energy-coupling factor transporter ATP-binding protein EcfA2